MTRDEADRFLKSRFPGRRFYINCYCWTYANGEAQPPDFNVCVYESPGRHESERVSEDGKTLRDAVERACAAKDAAELAAVEAEAMFAASADPQPMAPSMADDIFNRLQQKVQP